MRPIPELAKTLNLAGSCEELKTEGAYWWCPHCFADWRAPGDRHNSDGTAVEIPL
jgi:hypothetical protein